MIGPQNPPPVNDRSPNTISIHCHYRLYQTTWQLRSISYFNYIWPINTPNRITCLQLTVQYKFGLKNGKYMYSKLQALFYYQIFCFHVLDSIEFRNRSFAFVIRAGSFLCIPSIHFTSCSGGSSTSSPAGAQNLNSDSECQTIYVYRRKRGCSHYTHKAQLTQFQDGHVYMFELCPVIW